MMNKQIREQKKRKQVMVTQLVTRVRKRVTGQNFESNGGGMPVV